MISATGEPNQRIAAGCTAPAIQRSSSDTSGHASVAGGLTAINFEIANSAYLGATQSGLVLFATFIGGTAYFFGTILGAILVTYLQLGLTNVTLRHASITDVDESYGKFDYIIAHGVFSWIPTEVREKLLDICAKNMAPGGVAYVSYNTYPGWYLRGAAHDLMKFHTEGGGTAAVAGRPRPFAALRPAAGQSGAGARPRRHLLRPPVHLLHPIHGRSR